MNYKAIVAEAWQFTQDNKRMTIWYGAIPALFSTIVGIGYLLYQYYSFLASKLFQNWGQSFVAVFFERGLQILQLNRWLILPLLILLVIGLIFYFIVPVICQGALIQLIARRKNGQQIRTRQGLSYGLLSFLKLFEYGLLVRTFSIWSILSILTSAVRNFGFNILSIMIPILIVFVITGLALAICFTYAEFFIVAVIIR